MEMREKYNMIRKPGVADPHQEWWMPMEVPQVIDEKIYRGLPVP